MSREMKSPLEKIIGLISEADHQTPQKEIEIKDAARYLLALVDELSQFAQSKALPKR